MRNSVVDVQDVERLGLEDLQHFGGEGQGVGRVVEKRVGGHFHLVEEDVRVGEVHADRRRVADEMNVVAAGGKFLAEFGGDDAGAAISGITGDADAHGAALVLSACQVPYIRLLATVLLAGSGFRVLESRTRSGRMTPPDKYPIRRRSAPERDTAARRNRADYRRGNGAGASYCVGPCAGRQRGGGGKKNRKGCCPAR